MDQKSFELEKFKFELKKYENELQLRERELTLREIEIKNNRSKITSTRVAILVAIVGLFGTIATALLQGESSQKLERQKFESDIILKAATSDSLNQNKKNLQFLITAGFISDRQGKINKAINDSVFELKIISNPINTNFSTNDDFIIIDGKSINQLAEAMAIWYDKKLVIYTLLPYATFEGKIPRTASLENFMKLLTANCDVYAATYKNFLLIGLIEPPLKVYIKKSGIETTFHTKECMTLKKNITSFRIVTFKESLDLGHIQLCINCLKQPT